MSNQDHFKATYAYQDAVKDSPLIKAWLTRVGSAMHAMEGVEVEFATNFIDHTDDSKVYHDHTNQLVQAFVVPVLNSTDSKDPMDEESLPYYRVRFSDGVELIADDSELFSLDPRFGELISAVSGAFSCARALDFAGPWALSAEGSDDEKSEFLRAFADYSITLPSDHWKHNRNTPARFRTE